MSAIKLAATSKSPAAACPALTAAANWPSLKAPMKAWPPGSRRRTSISANGRATKGGFRAPSGDHAGFAVTLVAFPDRDNWEARCDEEDRRVKLDAQTLEPFDRWRRELLHADRPRIAGATGLAAGHLELRDVRHVFDRRGIAAASEKARERLPE